MQIQKEETRQQILHAAGQAFHQQGFAKTSMRDIARLSGMGVGNLYNYFPKGKDEIFRLIVSPLIQDMERMIYEHHDQQYAERYIDYLSGGNPELLAFQMREYLSLMRRHRCRDRGCRPPSLLPRLHHALATGLRYDGWRGGMHADLMAKDGLYARLWNIQEKALGWQV